MPLSILYDQTVSPLLGSDFVDMSLKAGLIGIILVMLFMIVYYRLPGVLASLALIFYGALVLAIFKLWPVTLTLAGLGGFIHRFGVQRHLFDPFSRISVKISHLHKKAVSRAPWGRLYLALVKPQGVRPHDRFNRKNRPMGRRRRP